MRKIAAFVGFSRPHTIIATSLQVVGIFILAGGLRDPDAVGLVVLVLALVSSLAANIYIVGLNQLTDVEIDQINKPYLPLASGEFTMRQGRWIVGLTGLLALGLAATQGVFLLLTVGLAIFVGTAYSLPPLRLKGRPIWAALSIAFVRGLVANIGLFLHFHQVLTPGAEIPWLLLSGVAAFFFGFGVVIALYKDIPDLSGDRQFGIRTFTVRLGPERVFELGRWILTAFYLVPITIAILRLPQPDAVVLLVTQLFIVVLFWMTSRGVNPAEPRAIMRFYMFLWSLFYAQYLLLSLNTILRTGASWLT